ncbi:pseudoazurin [Pseudosulfitobacter sp. DSM 107133]|uniref:pseudoazurin n=1 Tax=Pseudosulfitobacter sp. DSM 107133 TaxID=2883100 RepID=UPI000DF24C83|nr:pseudoazurin [Pseudosulfitobacter sp. DSM 107133]UOA27852.1 Pseudoazurin [Pseudosulfitobacter sp. DSM 107133]
MIKKLMAGAMLAIIAASANAETFEVRMLNKGEEGAMVFEPAYIKAEVGDVIHFVPTDKGHNVENIKGMLPDGVEPFKTKFNEEFELVVKNEGLYGVKCTPHYAMGMVALIQAGEPVNLDETAAVKHKGKAKSRMADLFEKVE